MSRLEKRRPPRVNTTINERGLRTLLDGLQVGVAYLSSSGRILFCNRGFADLLGYPSRRDTAGLHLRTLISAGSWPSLSTALQTATGAPVEGDLRIDSHTGTRFLRLSMGPLGSNIFAGAEIHATAVETTDVVNANAAVRQRENSLRSLAARILQVQDLERRRIARDLHDVTGQEIAAISMALGSLLNRCQSSRSGLAGDLSESMHLLRKVQDEIRTLSYVLHPPLLDERGLGSALEWYVDGFRKRSGIEVELKVPPNPVRLPVENEIALFRVLQEGLTNVLRHSKSSKAQILLSIERFEVELSIYDEGVGIGSQKPAGAPSAETGAEFGVGIPGMRERLGQLGGTLELQSGKSGTRLVARLPRLGAESSPEAVASVGRLDGEHASPGAHGPVARRKRILVVDDHEVVRQGIRTLLDHQAGLEVCGEASDGGEAVSKTMELHPDLVLLDLAMPGVGGLSAAQLIRAAGVQAKLLVFTTHHYPGLEKVIRAAGCDGYVQKARASEDLVSGIRAVLEGKSFFPSPTIPSITS